MNLFNAVLRVRTLACVVLMIAAPGSTALEVKDAQALQTIACGATYTSGESSHAPWRLSSLYDCDSRTLFIPYQLWTGAEWDGDKRAACMHESNSRFRVNGVSETTIIGPIEWHNPASGSTESVWSREKANGSKTQYFTCHELGIGRVYDSRGPWIFRSGRCKFPAGYGWQIGQRRSCLDTSIEITSIVLDEEHRLESLTFKWWYDHTLDHIYRYAPNVGMLNAWKQ